MKNIVYRFTQPYLDYNKCPISGKKRLFSLFLASSMIKDLYSQKVKVPGPIGLFPYLWSVSSLNGVRSDIVQSGFSGVLNPKD